MEHAFVFTSRLVGTRLSASTPLKSIPDLFVAHRVTSHGIHHRIAAWALAMSVAGLCLDASAQPTGNEQVAWFGNWRRDSSESTMMRPADNARTIALKSELLARGITRDEARIYLNALSGPDSIPSPDDCQAAARLWLPHFIACSPVLDPAQAGVDWSSVQKGVGRVLLERQITWEGLLVAHRKVADRKTKLPSDGECWLITSADPGEKPAMAFRIVPPYTPNEAKGVFACLSWERALAPRGANERAWACCRIASSVVLATDGLLPVYIKFENRSGETPLRVELRDGRRVIRDFTSFVASDLASASTNELATIPDERRIAKALGRSVDTMLVELLKSALAALDP